MSGDNEVKLTIHQAKPVIRWADPVIQRAEPRIQRAEPSIQWAEPSIQWAETQMQRVLTSSRWAGEPRIRSAIHDPKPRLSFINTKSLTHWIWVLTCEAGSEYILIFINEPFRAQDLSLSYVEVRFRMRLNVRMNMVPAGYSAKPSVPTDIFLRIELLKGICLIFPGVMFSKRSTQRPFYLIYFL